MYSWILLVMLVSALAGARLWRLFAVDTAGKPLRDLYYKLIPAKHYDLAEEGANCPFCSGFWITSAVFLLGLLSSGSDFSQGAWLVLFGPFAANYVGAQLNAWLDVHPITEGGGEVDTTEDTEADRD